MIASATAVAHANIALVKYWGKRDASLNLPATGSISLTLEALATTTTVRFDEHHSTDAMTLGARAASPKELAGLAPCLQALRAVAAATPSSAHMATWGAQIETQNNFPTAAGLASSASGYAALVTAAAAALALPLSAAQRSAIARLGSGSAARSIFGGLVRLHAGTRADGADCMAEPMANQAFAKTLAMVIVEVGGDAAKAHASRDAMEHCRLTSPYYGAWVDAARADLLAAEAAIAASDLPALGELAEANALAMHAAAIASRPAIIYWQPTTLTVLREVHELRRRGLHAWATMDAGPHVKVLTIPSEAARIAAALAPIAGVSRTTISGVGGEAVVTP